MGFLWIVSENGIDTKNSKWFFMMIEQNTNQNFNERTKKTRLNNLLQIDNLLNSNNKYTWYNTTVQDIQLQYPNISGEN